MADIKNCSNCGRMFQSVAGVKLCGRCRTSDDDIFKVVREYIYDNPGATIPEVSEATEVAEDKILKFLREGKLEIKGDGMLLDCEKCGASISSGRFCDACTREMTNSFKNVAKSMQASSNTQSNKGMYTQYKKN